MLAENREKKELGETKDVWSRCCVDIRRRGEVRGGAAGSQAGWLSEVWETRAGESLNRRGWPATAGHRHLPFQGRDFEFLCRALVISESIPAL